MAFLSSFWSVRFECLLQYYPSSLQDAEFACVVPLPHSGSAKVCPLDFETYEGRREIRLSFQKMTFRYDEQLARFTLPTQPTANALSSYLHAEGHTPTTATEALRTFGANEFDIPMPSFNELFQQHAVAPFFVFQMFCVGLWLLDEYWYYSLVTLMLLLVFEATVVKRRLKNLEDLRSMRVPPTQVWAYRNRKWLQMWTTELLPADLVSLTRCKGEAVVPCDVLLINGTCCVNEAMLTGESVPQRKDGVELYKHTQKY
jgi:cation-transporting ATPase 13A1